ncbi:hypothetical protein SDC9_137019 [bioreactor metagenome]|uniref:DUF4440 domain-containing protein n=1 Tax=bioreactor metagenome TaxID=1076179 RepID=A0A645DKD0_9ZZZZ
MSFEALSEKIIHLEKRLLDPKVRKSAEELDKLLADEFIEYCTSGHVCNKQEVLDSLPDNEEVEIIPSNFIVRSLAQDVVLLNFETFNTSSGVTSRRSSIWKLIDGTWQLFFHQGTKAKS